MIPSAGFGKRAVFLTKICNRIWGGDTVNRSRTPETLESRIYQAYIEYEEYDETAFSQELAPDSEENEQLELLSETSGDEQTDVTDADPKDMPDEKSGDQATGKSKKKQKKKQASVWSDLMYLIIKIGVVLLVILLLMTYVFGITRLDGVAMEPSVHDGDLVLFYRLDKRYEASDLVAVEYEDEVYALRVVAKEGDTVDVTEDGLFINGALQFEPFTYGSRTDRYEEGPDFPLTLKEDEFFLMADNREGATDSRVFGAVRREETLGKVMTVIRRRNF